MATPYYVQTQETEAVINKGNRWEAPIACHYLLYRVTNELRVQTSFYHILILRLHLVVPLSECWKKKLICLLVIVVQWVFFMCLKCTINWKSKNFLLRTTVYLLQAAWSNLFLFFFFLQLSHNQAEKRNIWHIRAFFLWKIVFIVFSRMKTVS